MRSTMLSITLLLTTMLHSQICPDIGDAKILRLQYLNVLKNREIKPSTVDTTVTLEKILTCGNDEDRFKNNQYVCITGYCINAKWGGSETCNCHSEDKNTWDIHLVIATDSTVTSEDSCVVCEITRKYRLTHTGLTPSDFKNHKLRLRGYMFRDDEHIKNSVNDAKKTTTDLFRKSPWELHPVVEIEVLK